MHATVSFRTIPRHIHFGFRSWVKSRLIGEGLVKEDEEFYIFNSTFGEASCPRRSRSLYSPPATTDLTSQGITPSSLLLRHSPLASLEIALLCTAQHIAVPPEELQAPVLRPAVPAHKVTVVEVDESSVIEAQAAVIEGVAGAPRPSISVILPTLKDNDSKPVSPLLPVHNITGVAGNPRPFGNWDGKKKASHRQVADDENLAPAQVPRNPRAYPSRPMMHRRGAFMKHV